MMKINKLLINLIVLVVSISVGLLLCEFAPRLVLNPSDFLSLEVVSDPRPRRINLLNLGRVNTTGGEGSSQNRKRFRARR